MAVNAQRYMSTVATSMAGEIEFHSYNEYVLHPHINSETYGNTSTCSQSPRLSPTYNARLVWNVHMNTHACRHVLDYTYMY